MTCKYKSYDNYGESSTHAPLPRFSRPLFSLPCLGRWSWGRIPSPVSWSPLPNLLGFIGLGSFSSWDFKHEHSWHLTTSRIYLPSPGGTLAFIALWRVMTIASFWSKSPLRSVECLHPQRFSRRLGLVLHCLRPLLFVHPVTIFLKWVGTPRPLLLRRNETRVTRWTLLPDWGWALQNGTPCLSTIVLLFYFFCVSFVLGIWYGFSCCFLLALVWVVCHLVEFFLWARCSVGPIPEGLGVACFSLGLWRRFLTTMSQDQNGGLYFSFCDTCL